METRELIENIKTEILDIKSSQKSAKVTKIANKYYKLIPKDTFEFLNMCEIFISSDFPKFFSIATIWIKKRTNLINPEYFKIFEKWLFSYIDTWGKCDQYCYRILNPFIESYPELFEHNKNWIKSEKIYVRRAAAVSLIKSVRGFHVDASLDKIFYIVDNLKSDKHIHIQKAVGWLLKYAYLTYPDEILDYLVNNVKNLARTSFRYALEKVPKETKRKMMSLN